ncbi:MAG: 2OG-Fe(II) oxygenase family protein [Phenylobacterium sp.]|nr:2OG-Fe(II) oxygenase family protein [Phenylobacterium sp.]
MNDKPYDIGLDALAQFPPERARQLADAVADRAREGFQYQYDAWRLSDLMERGETPDGALAPLAQLYRLLNGEAFLGLIRDLTGEPRAAFADAQATRYRAGDFLTAHDDDVEGKNRLFAYVLGMTPGWRPDWGGLLLFHGPEPWRVEGVSPGFNQLSLFRVPQPHGVSQVAHYVQAHRCSITGWIRYRD